jgi:hypothetical protein
MALEIILINKNNNSKLDSRAAQNSSARESTTESAQATRITGMSLDVRFFCCVEFIIESLHIFFKGSKANSERI